MSWLESQIDLRKRYDVELTEQAYAELAASVSDPKDAPIFVVDDLEQADGAVNTCLRYNGVKAGEVPEGVERLEERLEYLCYLVIGGDYLVSIVADYLEFLFLKGYLCIARLGSCCATCACTCPLSCSGVSHSIRS